MSRNDRPRANRAIIARRRDGSARANRRRSFALESHARTSSDIDRMVYQPTPSRRQVALRDRYLKLTPLVD
jgi:hypothetical protein